MKNLFKITVAVFAVAIFSFNANAQFNAGIDIALPMGDFADGASMGYGISAGYEHKMGDNMGIGGELGYLMFSSKTDLYDGFFDDVSYSQSMIPILAHFKYYFTENTNGMYAKAALGMTMYKVTLSYTSTQLTGFDSNLNPIYSTVEQDLSSSDTFLTYGVGAGYLVNEKIDIAAEYRIVSGDGGSADYINVGVAYNF